MYEKLDPIAHIHKRPDMYIGSLKPREQAREWVLGDDGKIVEKERVVYSDGLVRIFVEALSNAIDNAWRSRKADVKMTKVKVSMNEETGETSIWNDGLHIPVEVHPTEKIYNPDLIFGHLLTGSNMDDTEQRLSSGRKRIGHQAPERVFQRVLRRGPRPREPPLVQADVEKEHAGAKPRLHPRQPGKERVHAGAMGP